MSVLLLNFAFLRPLRCEKCSTRKLFVSEKRVQRKWNQFDRSSFEIFTTKTINFSYIDYKIGNRVTGFRNYVFSNASNLHHKIFQLIFQLINFISQYHLVPKLELRSKNLNPNRFEYLGYYNDTFVYLVARIRHYILMS